MDKWCAVYVIKMEITLYRNVLNAFHSMLSSSLFQPSMVKLWCYQLIHMVVGWYRYTCSATACYPLIASISSLFMLLHSYTNLCHANSLDAEGAGALWWSYNTANNDGWDSPVRLLVGSRSIRQLRCSGLPHDIVANCMICIIYLLNLTKLLDCFTIYIV